MFDIERFICEVEKRPGLYNSKTPEYNDKDLKMRLWEQVAMIMYDNWDELSLQERTEIGENLQTRWKSLRDQFRKEVKAAAKATQNGQLIALKKKKKYVHFDQLMFLLPSLKGRPIAFNSEDANDLYYEPSISYVETISICKPEVETLEEPVPSPPQKTERDSSCAIAPRKRSARSSDETEIREMKSVLLDSSAVQNESRDMFGNRAFLMSLLPLLDAMPEEHMLDCRMQMMENARYYRFLPSTEQEPLPSGSAVCDPLRLQRITHHK